MRRFKGLHGDDIDFEHTWGVLASAFREIHTKNASRLSYEELYRHAYKIVLKKRGEQLYNRVCEFEHDWLSSEVRGNILNLVSPNLLATAQNLAASSNSVKRDAGESLATGERFLKGLKVAWQDHQICVSMLADVLMYMV